VLEFTRSGRSIAVDAARAGLIALLASAALAGAAHANSGPNASHYRPASPLQRFGVNAQVMFWGMPSDTWKAQLTEMREDGIELVRADAAWASVQPTAQDGAEHRYQWRDLDRIEVALASEGLRWLPIIDYSAPWAARGTAAQAPDPHAPPSDDEAYAQYAAALVARYGSGGSFWSTHPELPAEPVKAVEIWNEENIALFWHPAPNAATYLHLYEAARGAIHAISPRVEVLVGGLSNPAAQFLDAMYTAGGDDRDLFDGVAIHPYATEASEVERMVALTRRALDAHGDFDTPLDVTEVGWPSLWPNGLLSLLPPPTGSTPFLSDAQRASELTSVTATLAASDCGVERILPDTWVSSQASRSDPEDWYGIVSPAGVQSQSAHAYSQAISSLERAPLLRHAANSLCGRTLKLSVRHVGAGRRPHARRHRTPHEVCALAKVSSQGVAIDHAIVSFTAIDARTEAPLTRPASATTDGAGTALRCYQVGKRRTVVLLISARRADFSNEPSERVHLKAS
jgi:hypothetical protein